MGLLKYGCDKYRFDKIWVKKYGFEKHRLGLKKPYLKFLGLPNPDLNFGHITKPGPAKRGDPFIFSPIFLTLSIQSSIINTLCNEQFSKLGSVFFSKVIPRPFKIPSWVRSKKYWLQLSKLGTLNSFPQQQFSLWGKKIEICGNDLNFLQFPNSKKNKIRGKYSRNYFEKSEAIFRNNCSYLI